MPILSLPSPLTSLFRREQLGWIGIDVGSAALKIAQIERRSGKTVIAASALVENPYPNDWMSEAQDLSWIRRALQENLLEFHRLGSAPAACVLSPSATEIRAIELPGGSDDELRAMAEEELKTSFPERADDLQFDLWEAPTPGAEANSATATLNALVTSRKLTERVASEIAACGLDCRVLDGQPWSATRAAQLALQGERAQTSVAILDWGCTTAQLTVARQGKPLFTRSMRDCGLSGVVNSISQGLSISAADVPHLLSTYGLPAPGAAAGEQQRLRQLLGDMLADSLKRLVDELTKTLQYLKLQWAAHAPEHLLLIGGGAAIRNVDANLKEALEMPVETWRLPGDSNGNEQLNEQLGDVPPQLLANAVALSGLAWQS